MCAFVSGVDPAVRISVMMSGAAAMDWLHRTKERVKPWVTFADTGRFKLPSGLAVVPKRVVTNVKTFQGNYLFVFFGLVLFCVYVVFPLTLTARWSRDIDQSVSRSVTVSRFCTSFVGDFGGLSSQLHVVLRRLGISMDMLSEKDFVPTNSLYGGQISLI